MDDDCDLPLGVAGDEVLYGFSCLGERIHGVDCRLDGALVDEATTPFQIGLALPVDDEGEPLAYERRQEPRVPRARVRSGRRSCQRRRIRR